MIGSWAFLSAPQNSGNTAHQANQGQGGPAEATPRQGCSASAASTAGISSSRLSGMAGHFEGWRSTARRGAATDR